MIKKGYVLLAGWMLLAACEDPVLIQFLEPNLIFPRAVKIDVPPYHYTVVEDSVIYVYGDSLFTVDSVCDTVNNTPFLKWQKTNAPFIVAAIFNEIPEISNNNKNITNKNSIVWLWHSGLTNNGEETGEGIHYEEGRRVVDMENEIFKDIVKPLDSNTVYYWGVWGWNKEGTEVKFSTLPLKMYVD